jgi:hypothetical protein
MLRNSPTALRVLKSALNAAEDGQAGIQQLGGDATLLFYQSEEGNEVGAWTRLHHANLPRLRAQSALAGYRVSALSDARLWCDAGAASVPGEAGARLCALQAASVTAACEPTGLDQEEGCHIMHARSGMIFSCKSQIKAAMYP